MNAIDDGAVAAYPPAFPARGYDFTRYVPARSWIGGLWRDGSAGTEPVLNPRYGKAIGEVSLSSAEDTALAVDAARTAFPEWRDTPIKERVQVLYRLKHCMQRDLEELIWVVSHENGKVREQAEGSVLKAIECIEMGCSIPNMAAGGQIDVSRGINCRVTYEPLGVCAGVTPFNFPIMVPFWMLPQALVAGNTFVLKPSEQVPYGAVKLAALLHEAGLPPGVLNVVQGKREAVEALVDHKDVKAMGFVGSTPVARAVYERGTVLGRRMLCLGSAKNHLLVVPDADLELTADTMVASFTGCSGQRCMAAAVMVAVGDVQGVIDRMVDIAREIRLGEDMGPIISGAALERITGLIDGAEKMGARVIVDGRGAGVEGCPGNWLGPTLIDGVTPEMPAYREEIFGPVLCIVHTDSLDEALDLENRNPYGNAASIFTTRGGVARYALERLEAGMCGVNIGVPVPREPFSFGGWNASKFGHGDLTGLDGFRYWTRPRKVTEKWATHEDETWMS